jgi:serine/threonine-protein kinase RsbW
VVNHGLKRDAARTFSVQFDRIDGAFFIELRDTGPAFDPTAAPRKAQAADDDLPGGLGIELVRRQMDELRYERVNEINVLRLTKRLPPATLSPDRP